MAVSESAVRLWLTVCGVRAMQAGGFGCERSANFSFEAGANREAGGTFTKKEKAEEERYFRERTKEQLAALKKQHEEEITHHKKEIEHLQKEIDRHKQNIKKLKDHD
uniref:ATPase inhibitor, mitochondrial n=1 Tax=Myotis lucifugus TaxID=59463 RepID=G1PGS1_MYOLU